MAKTPVNFCIDSELLASLKAYATQTGCTVIELVERFCQQGLGMAPEGSIPDLDTRIDRRKDNLLIERMGVVETDVKSILERLSVLESKVDVDVDVEDYLQNWQNSLELKIASLVDTFVEKHVEEILGSARRLAEIRHPVKADPVSDVKPALIPTSTKGLVEDYQIDSDYDDEPDEILTSFLEPQPVTVTPSHLKEKHKDGKTFNQSGSET